MKLRNSHLAVVERHKIIDYLLNSRHPDNGGKAQFFESLGFRADASELLIDSLRVLAQTGEVVEIIKSHHGEKYVVDGPVSSQTESAAAVWCEPSGSSIRAWKHLVW